METKSLGKTYEDGEYIIKQGEIPECMFVIQSGKVEIVKTEIDKEIILGSLEGEGNLGQGEFFGEMALFENQPHSVSVRAKGQVRVLTVDKKTLLRSIKNNPTIAFHFIQQMSARLRKVNAELTRMKIAGSQDWQPRPPEPSPQLELQQQ